ncbi:MAG: iron-sulfur cluster assembly scaffold protein [Candidatus Ancaeobacter aquaticus]|nr:iron-sulfur cluster assembly scaffold protein [Candidatus Ancaeobacter aquaticus]
MRNHRTKIAVDEKKIEPEFIATVSKEARHFGRMNDPTSAAHIKGPCGDEMEFYLSIYDRRIEDVKFYTKGCVSTTACGEITARLVCGKTIDDALGISPKRVVASLKGLSSDHCHCSILAVSTLYRAIADYLLEN